MTLTAEKPPAVSDPDTCLLTSVNRAGEHPVFQRLDPEIASSDSVNVAEVDEDHEN